MNRIIVLGLLIICVSIGGMTGPYNTNPTPTPTPISPPLQELPAQKDLIAANQELLSLAILPTDTVEAIQEKRYRKSRIWSLMCGQLSRSGYGYGGIFITRWSDMFNYLSPYLWCVKNGEPAYASQLLAQIINGWLEGWLIAKMARDQGKNFTEYGVIESLIGFEPDYPSFAKKLVKLRELLHEEFNLYRASIPTTLDAFEEALDDIAKEAGFKLSTVSGPQDLVKCFMINQKDLKPSGTEGIVINKAFYKIKNDSVFYEQDPKHVKYFYFTPFIPRTHYPYQFFTPLHSSSVLSCEGNEISRFREYVESKVETIFHKDPLNIPRPNPYLSIGASR